MHRVTIGTSPPRARCDALTVHLALGLPHITLHHNLSGHVQD